MLEKRNNITHNNKSVKNPFVIDANTLLKNLRVFA